ncbi:MAG: TVP38/TMEM64 family protein [Gemmatimonadota bacterium]|nr:TVP38/TMEM64 family protein [Gemmatimonadota bacterium]
MEQFFYDIGEWMRAAGPWAYVVAPLVMAAVAILPIPAEAPAMVNGMLFGPVGGTAVTWCGAMLGAVASFEIARALGRPAAEKLLKPSALSRADDFVQRAGWGGLLLARFMPLIAFTVLNWGAGLTPVRRWRFLWTTAVGIIPGAIVFTVSGWGLTNVLEKLPWFALALAALLLGWMWWRRRTGIESEDEDPGPK